MTATISFCAGTGSIANLAGSGLGFYGDSGFGSAVSVGSYQGHSFCTDAAGVIQGPEACNVKYLSANSGILGQASSGVALTHIPNYLATLNIRANFDTSVQVQNCQVKIYDRVLSTSPASGVTSKLAEIIHVDGSQSTVGSGDATWTTFSNVTGVSLPIANSPGSGGMYAGNGSTSTHSDTQHDFYLAISCSPDSIGSKAFGLFCQLEYL